MQFFKYSLQYFGDVGFVTVMVSACKNVPHKSEMFAFRRHILEQLHKIGLSEQNQSSSRVVASTAVLDIMMNVTIINLLLARLWARLVTLVGVFCRMSGSVMLHRGPASGFTRTGQAMTSWRLQSNYSFMVTLHGRPVLFHPVRATQLVTVSTV